KTFMPDLQILTEGKKYFYSNDVKVHKAQREQGRKAEPEEIALGCRIDMTYLPEPVGRLQDMNPEIATVLHEHFLELIGDDSNLENCIS
ncbi:hypothetical protein DWA16_20440, partial [Acinetobacter baumannii]|uniref:hypothetical protein n=1 Tax=Acinetobacter baumannii TaxID=470 RepID=UPI001059C540